MQPMPNPQDSDYLSTLNPPQLQAVEALDGPVLVLAGAGTGKTKVLTSRIARLIETGRAWPSQILAVTFTNKAANEMKNRVMDLVPQSRPDGWWLGTFHSLACRLLRQRAELVGLTSNFTILDPDDQLRLLKQIGESLNIDVKKHPPKLMAAIIDRWKDKAITPNMLKAEDVGHAVDGKMLLIYKTYQERLKTLNACDFGDLLLHNITIWKNPQHKDILHELQNKFRYILVDEYQDTNIAQYQWLRLLAMSHQNICCVGDDDQSIYGWRGAEVGNILRFEKDYPGAIVVRLEQNYRSTSHILDAASHLIAKNQGRLGKTLWSSEGEGEKITVRGVWDAPSEANYVAATIDDLRRTGHALKDIAILVRAGFQTREFEERFIRMGLPYKVVGGLRFYERQEIRDAMAYLRVVMQPADDLAFERIVNVPKRGVGDGTLQKLHDHARSHSVPLTGALEDLLSISAVKGKAQENLQILARDFTRWRNLVSTMPPADLAQQILDESGYTEMWKKETTPDAPGRLENLKELVNAIAEFESMEAFLEHVSLVMDVQENSSGDQVTIMTLHAAKGLEFNTVFCTGWEEGLFPSQRSMDENGVQGLEEERRLAYVGITRARRKLYITHAANRQIYGSWMSSIPSRFIDELPEEALKREAERGMAVAGSHFRLWDETAQSPSPSSGKRQYIEAPVRQLAAPQENAHGFSIGCRVKHPHFGTGTVFHMEGNKLDIKFPDGVKRILDSFVTLA